MELTDKMAEARQKFERYITMITEDTSVLVPNDYRRELDAVITAALTTVPKESDALRDAREAMREIVERAGLIGERALVWNAAAGGHSGMTERTITLQDAEKIISVIEEKKPKGATGIYVSTKWGISYGFRTNERKFPESFLPLWKL